MYHLWATNASAPVRQAPPTALVLSETSGNAPLSDAIEGERSRQRSVDLLRSRAFAVRESTAEQTVQAQQVELNGLRAQLAQEKASAERRAEGLGARLNGHRHAVD